MRPAADAVESGTTAFDSHEFQFFCGSVLPCDRNLTLGEHVSCESHIVCQTCIACRTGNAHVCENTRILGVDVNGGFAEYVAVPQHILYRLPPSVSFEQAASLPVAYGTARSRHPAQQGLQPVGHGGGAAGVRRERFELRLRLRPLLQRQIVVDRIVIADDPHDHWMTFGEDFDPRYASPPAARPPWTCSSATCPTP